MEDSAILWSPVLISSIILFTYVYALSYYTLLRRWKGKKRNEASSCCVSIIHGTTITALAAYDVYASAWDLAAPNSKRQNMLLEFGSAYFIVDLGHYLLFNPEDYLFILHHIATSTYMLSCRYFVGYGALSAMAMVAVGEATSLFQNIWTICRLGRDQSQAMKRVYEGLSPFFTVLFTLFRVVIGPTVVYKISKFYFSGGADGVIPRYLVYSWMAKATLALVGSMVWVYKLWVGLIKFYGTKNGIKQRKASKNLEDRKRIINEVDKAD